MSSTVVLVPIEENHESDDLAAGRSQRPLRSLSTTGREHDADECLLPQPERPLGHIYIVEVRGGTDKRSNGHRGDTLPIANSLIREGWACYPIFYSDDDADEVAAKLSSANAFIVRVNPGTYDGVTQERLDTCLRSAAAAGAVAMSHPNVMRQMGAKDALYKIRGLSCGMPDTRAYYDMASFKAAFPTTLATGPRVVKQNRGSQGEGIWVVKLERPDETVQESSMLVLQEARDNHIERRTLADFMEYCACYLEGEDGLLVDQRFLPRISEGEYRINLIFEFPIEVVHKKPRAGGISATLSSGAEYTSFSPTDPEVSELVTAFLQRDLPEIMPALGMHQTPLPLIWAADFILDDKFADGKEKYCIGEFNCSCVGITKQLHLSPLVAQAAIRIIAASQAAAIGMSALVACEVISQQLEHPEDMDPSTISASAELIDRAAHDVGLELCTPRSRKLPGELKAFFASKSRSTDKLDELQDALHAHAEELSMAAASKVVDYVQMNESLTPASSPTAPSSGQYSPTRHTSSPRSSRLRRESMSKEQLEHDDIVQQVPAERSQTGQLPSPRTNMTEAMPSRVDDIFASVPEGLSIVSASPMKIAASAVLQVMEAQEGRVENSGDLCRILNQQAHC